MIDFSVDLDITGSPLKAGFDPNEVFDNSNDDVLIISKKAQAPIFRFGFSFFRFLRINHESCLVE